MFLQEILYTFCQELDGTAQSCFGPGSHWMRHTWRHCGLEAASLGLGRMTQHIQGQVWRTGAWDSQQEKRIQLKNFSSALCMGTKDQLVAPPQSPEDTHTHVRTHTSVFWSHCSKIRGNAEITMTTQLSSRLPADLSEPPNRGRTQRTPRSGLASDPQGLKIWGLKIWGLGVTSN